MCRRRCRSYPRSPLLHPEPRRGRWLASFHRQWATSRCTTAKHWPDPGPRSSLQHADWRPSRHALRQAPQRMCVASRTAARALRRLSFPRCPHSDPRGSQCMRIQGHRYTHPPGTRPRTACYPRQTAVARGKRAAYRPAHTQARRLGCTNRHHAALSRARMRHPRLRAQAHSWRARCRSTAQHLCSR